MKGRAPDPAGRPAGPGVHRLTPVRRDDRREGRRRPASTTCDAQPMSDALAAGGYGDLLAQITSEVRVARLRAARTVNSELVALSVDRTSGGLADRNRLLRSPAG